MTALDVIALLMTPLGALAVGGVVYWIATRLRRCQFYGGLATATCAPPILVRLLAGILQRDEVGRAESKVATPPLHHDPQPATAA